VPRLTAASAIISPASTLTNNHVDVGVFQSFPKCAPRACTNATVDLEAVPDYPPEAKAEETAGHAL